jgi:phage N-6-adenine-methyltransferase
MPNQAQLEAHPAANLFPLLQGEELAALVADVKAHGLRVPIVLHEGKVLDGRNRHAACRLAGVEPRFEEWAGEDPAAYVISANIHRRHLTESQRAMLLAEVRRACPNWDIRKAAAKSNTSKASIGRADEVISSGAPELVEAVRCGDVRLGAAVEVAKLEPEEQRAIVEAGPERVREAAAEIRNSTYRTTYTGDNEWYTPAAYIEAARRALGAIDLDPASCEVAQKAVGAARFYSAEQDGLTRAWDGRVWLNPPYSQPLVSQFVEKLVSEVEAGRTKAAIALLNNSTDTEWFHRAAKSARAICFTRGRIRFEKPGREAASPLQGSAFFYFGTRVAAFAEAFADIGLLVEVRR